MPVIRSSRRIANRIRIGGIRQKGTPTSGTELLPVSPVQEVFNTYELVANILSYLPPISIVGTERVSKMFMAATDHPQCRTLTFMRPIDDTLLLPSTAETACAALCPLLEPSSRSGCHFRVVERSCQFYLPGSWERMYLTNPPAKDALVRMKFRNTRFWGATISTTLRISDPAGLTLGSILSRKSQGTFSLGQCFNPHGELNIHAPKSLINNPIQRSCNYEGVVGDFIEEQEKRFGGSFKLLLSENDSWENPKIGLIDDTVVWDGPKHGRTHHVMLPSDPCGVHCRKHLWC
jgi:hypothetical protein